MILDVLFVDMVTPRPYNWETLEKESLGGTESSVIRLSEGFATKGLKVAIMQPFEFIAHQSDNKVWYMPLSWASALKPKNVICLRALPNFEQYPNAKWFVWFHDLATTSNYSAYLDTMVKYNATGIAVSDWHVQNILQHCPGMPIKRIYSPVDESCYSYVRQGDVDNLQLVWLSSPHKGLDKALDLFQTLRETNPGYKLVVFNPGYWFETQKPMRNVINLPKAKREIMRSIISRSLCVFYPTAFEETFGLVAAEANAMGTPLACYKVAALAESVSPGNGFCASPEELAAKIGIWSNGGRPVVSGQEEFRFEEIYKDWEKILKIT